MKRSNEKRDGCLLQRDEAAQVGHLRLVAAETRTEAMKREVYVYFKWMERHKVSEQIIWKLSK
jgi:hypothetical protein